MGVTRLPTRRLPILLPIRLVCVTDQFPVTTSATLPVNLLTYEVTLVNKKVILQWSTAAETNNRGFRIERSANGTTFTPIGSVSGSGNSVTQFYSFVDENPLPGRSFYRLVQEDIDSRTQFLGVKRIDNNIGRTFDVKTLGSVNAKLVLQVIRVKPGPSNPNIRYVR